MERPVIRSALKKSHRSAVHIKWKCTIEGLRSLTRLREAVRASIAKGDKQNVNQSTSHAVTDNNCLVERTSLVTDEGDFKVRKIVKEFNECEASERSGHRYRKLKQAIEDKKKQLMEQQKLLKMKLRELKKVWKPMEMQTQKMLEPYKKKQWCRFCHNLAKQTVQCCAIAEYCSFSHYIADRYSLRHFVECRRPY